MKTNKGITIVSLIITVIVLLILTIVAIRLITGDGVLDKAKTATNSYEDKRKEEENILGDYADKIEITRETTKVYGTEEFYIVKTPNNRAVMYANGTVYQEYTFELEDTMEGLEKPEEWGEGKFITVDGQPMSFITSDETKIYVVGGTQSYSLNNELAKKVLKQKGTYECYPIILGSINIVCFVENNTFEMYAVQKNGTTSKIDYAVNNVKPNDSKVTIYVEGNKVELGPEARKIQTNIKGESETLFYYIQDSKFYIEASLNGIVDGLNNCLEIPLSDYDISKFGFFVVE